jgi:nicotinamidase-related amidase
MALTALDPVPALVVIDLQKGILALPTVHPVDQVVARAATLAAAFRRHRLPVVLVNVNARAPGRTEAPAPALAPEPGWADLLDELDAQPSDLRVTKSRWGAFYATTLDHDLRERGVTQVVLAGIATAFGVESTARGASEYGYNVVLAVDAMTDREEAAHDRAVRLVFPRLGETATTDEIVAVMDATLPAAPQSRGA